MTKSVYMTNLKNEEGEYTLTLIGDKENLKEWLTKEYKEMCNTSDYFGCEPVCRDESSPSCEYCYKKELKKYELRDNSNEEYKTINLDEFIDSLI